MVDFAREIRDSAELLAEHFAQIPSCDRKKQCIPFTWGVISPQDLLAYQIGWGTLLLGWYRQGEEGSEVVQPCEGFTKWDYKGLAEHLFKKYCNATAKDFLELASEIEEVARIEAERGRLTTLGSFSWCTLASGKQWPLEKWIRVNTVSPYKRAIKLLKKTR